MADSSLALCFSPPTEIAARVRSGEFFREARLVYHQRYHDLMTERYLYLSVTGVSLCISLMAFVAVNLFFPLKTNVPFIYTTRDSVSDLPRMRLIGNPGEDANLSLRRFLVENYVRMREEYRVEWLERNDGGVISQSAPDVAAEYRAWMDPRNPDSPVTRFQRRATRSVRSVQVRSVSADTNQMEARVEAVVEDGLVQRKEVSVANITFRFEDIQVDQKTGATTPLTFIVTAYTSTPVQE